MKNLITMPFGGLLGLIQGSTSAAKETVGSVSSIFGDLKYVLYGGLILVGGILLFASVSFIR